jgi:hypothetical protein
MKCRCGDCRDKGYALDLGWIVGIFLIVSAAIVILAIAIGVL